MAFAGDIRSEIEVNDPTFSPQWKLPVSKKTIPTPGLDPQSLGSCGFAGFMDASAPQKELSLATGGCHKTHFDVGHKLSEPVVERPRKVAINREFTPGEALSWNTRRAHFADKHNVTTFTKQETPKVVPKKQAPCNIHSIADLAGVEDRIKLTYGVHGGASGKMTVDFNGNRIAPTQCTQELSPRMLYGRKKAVDGINQNAESDHEKVVKNSERVEFKKDYFSSASVGKLGVLSEKEKAELKIQRDERKASKASRKKKSYSQKCAEQKLHSDVKDVELLDDWKPSLRRGQVAAEELIEEHDESLNAKEEEPKKGKDRDSKKSKSPKAHKKK